MDSATWRRRIVPQFSCQTRQDVFSGLNNQSQMELEKRSLNHSITAKRFSATPPYQITPRPESAQPSSVARPYGAPPLQEQGSAPKATHPLAGELGSQQPSGQTTQGKLKPELERVGGFNDQSGSPPVQQFPGPSQFLQPPTQQSPQYVAAQQTQPTAPPQQGQPYVPAQQSQGYAQPPQGQPYVPPQQNASYSSPPQGQLYVPPQQSQGYAQLPQGSPTFLPSRTRPIHRRSRGSRMFLLSRLMHQIRPRDMRRRNRCLNPSHLSRWGCISQTSTPCLASRQITHFIPAGRPPCTAGFSMLAAVVASITTATWKPARLNDRAADRCSAPSGLVEEGQRSRRRYYWCCFTIRRRWSCRQSDLRPPRPVN